MHFFEVLTLSLETGRNLEEAFLVTINSVSSSLSLEFKEALREVKYGKSLTEALIGEYKNYSVIVTRTNDKALVYELKKE